MNKIYAGIGSRETPDSVLHSMYALAQDLAVKGWTLRSGRGKPKENTPLGFGSADITFERAARRVNGKCEIYLPNLHNVMSIQEIAKQEVTPEVCYMDEVRGSVVACQVITRLLHPNGKNLNKYAMELHSRNVYQILGKDLNTPVDFVVCYTVNGSGQSGTGQAIRLAKMLNIPVYDFGVCNVENTMELHRFVEYLSYTYGGN